MQRLSISGKGGLGPVIGISGGLLSGTEKIEVENLNHPGRVRRVDAQMYRAMRRSFLKVLPETFPGLTLEEIRERLPAQLPAGLFPGGARAGWWAKTVQVDLEAKGIVARGKTRPLRLRKA